MKMMKSGKAAANAPESSSSQVARRPLWGDDILSLDLDLWKSILSKRNIPEQRQEYGDGLVVFEEQKEDRCF